MDWSPQQAAALKSTQEWLDDPQGPKVFRLFGFAGTGKSTLAKHIGVLEDARGGYVQYAAFTGKAAVVMRKKGCVNARTIHSLIYKSHDKSRQELDRLTEKFKTAQGLAVRDLGEQIEAEKANLRAPGFTLKPDALTVWDEDEETGYRSPRYIISLFVIDECSMVDERLGADLLSFGARVIVLGDPAQLPPVYGGGYFTNAKPDVMLTEIHRQALDSPIISMANKIRQGGSLPLGDYGQNCSVVTTAALTADDWMAADQILVGKNATRQAFNARMRTLLGFEGFLPQPGEKLVCLRNNHDIGLLNGSLWECISCEDKPQGEMFLLKVKSLDEDNREVTCLAHKSYFLGTDLDSWDRKDANEFDFGYALTVHKSQGSQWNNVMLYDEWRMPNSKTQWQYTGVTRAAERITVVRP